MNTLRHQKCMTPMRFLSSTENKLLDNYQIINKINGWLEKGLVALYLFLKTRNTNSIEKKNTNLPCFPVKRRESPLFLEERPAMKYYVSQPGLPLFSVKSYPFPSDSLIWWQP